MSRREVMILDNYDSFTYNLAQYLEEIGATVTVYRNDEISAEGILDAGPSHLVISPGPGRPVDAGVSREAVLALKGKTPILGVCLGHQVIAETMGGRVLRGPAPVHGKTSMIEHDGRTIFKGIDNPFEATRYHSLIVDRDGFPDCMEITSTAENGIIMGARHREFPIEGVQFHPESILTGPGHAILENFLNLSIQEGP
ncbi:MAG: aminodeoxychorismate/anthranilate synthase component II [Actinobacteria bacterium]|nr:aminodeoxychorismate/anthranilate synthase component II [Actinomycetota bacterium]